MSARSIVRNVGRRSVLAGLASLAAAPSRAQVAGADGFDPGGLEEAARRARGLDQLNALIVARGGTVALAEAYRGPPPDRPVNVKSVSKTIVATLAGIAISRGVLESVDQPVSDLLSLPPDADPRAGAITVGDLLTMRAGLERTSGAGYGPWVASGDWVAYALSRPMVAEPGGRFLYSTGSFHLLGAMLAAASKRSLLALAREWLGDPLAIEIPPWTRDPQGLYLGGNEMAIAPTGLLRFGEVWRRGGTWDGRQVVPASWTREAWTPRARSPFSGDAYGYGWFLRETGGHRVAYARGYGGQMVYVVPSLALTVVVTSDPTRPARSDGHVGDLNALLSEVIVPAAEAA